MKAILMNLTLALLMIVIPTCVAANDYSSGFELGMMSWESSNWQPHSSNIDITIRMQDSVPSSPVVLYKDFFNEINNQRERSLIRSLQRRQEYEYKPYSENSAIRNFKADFYDKWEDR